MTRHVSATQGIREPMEERVYSAQLAHTKWEWGLVFAPLVGPIRPLQLEASVTQRVSATLGLGEQMEPHVNF